MPVLILPVSGVVCVTVINIFVRTVPEAGRMKTVSETCCCQTVRGTVQCLCSAYAGCLLVVPTPDQAHPIGIFYGKGIRLRISYVKKSVLKYMENFFALPYI